MDEIEWPEGLSPYKVAFYLQPHVGGQESPLTRTRKTYGLSAPRWIARLTFRAGHGYDPEGRAFGPRADDASFFAARLDAFIAEMEGGLFPVRFHDFRRPRPQSYLTQYSPDMTVEAAPVGASSIVINRARGAIGPSIGDYVGGDGRPHIVTSVSPKLGSMMSVGSADGKITIGFKPPLSAPLTAGSMLEIEEVSALFQLTSEDAGQNEGEFGTPIEYVLEFSEKLP